MNLFRRRDRKGVEQAARAREAAEVALAEERKRLEEMKAETAHYAALAGSLKFRRERNHISEHLTALYQGGSK